MHPARDAKLRLAHHIIHPEDRELALQYHEQRMRGNLSKRGYQLRILTKDGTVKWLRHNVSTIWWEDRPAGLGLLTDITEQRLMEENLRRARDELEIRVEERTVALKQANEKLLLEISERRRMEDATKVEKRKFETLCDEAPFAMMLIDQEGTFEYVNPKFKDMFGYDLADVCNGREWFGKAFPDPSYRHKVINVWVDDIRTHKAGELRPRIFVVTCRDGTRKTISFGSVQLPSGQHLVTCEDITERKRAEENLRLSESAYRTLAQNIPGIVYRAHLTDPPRTEFFNNAVESITGFSEEELRTGEVCSIDPLIQPEDRLRVIEKVKQALVGNMPLEMEYRIIHKNGGIKHLVDYGRPIRGTDGSEVHIDGVIFDITDRKQAEEALRESEEKFSKLFQNSPDAITLTELTGNKLVDVNENYTRISGYSREESIGRTTIELGLDPDDRNKFITALKEKGRVLGFEAPFKTKAGKIIICSISGDLIEIQGKQYLLGVVRDETERKRVEEALQASEHRYSAFLNSTTDLAFIKDEESRYVVVNKANQDFFGKAEHEIIGKTDFELMPAHAAENCRTSDLEALRHGGIVFAEEEIGGRAFETKKFPVPLMNGKTGVGGLIREVTERKRAEEALRQSEEKHRLVVDKAQEGILISQEGMIRFVNPKALEILACSEQELFSMPFTEFIHPDDREMVYSRYVRRLKGEQFQSRYSVRILTRDRAVKWVESDATTITWQGSPAALVFLNDVTERVRMEQALKESEERYRSLVEESFDGMFILKGSKIVFANSRLHQMLGYSPGELEGLDYWTIYHPDYWELTRERATARMRGENVVSQYEVKLQRKDGTGFDGELSARAVQVKGEPGVLVWVRDISERKSSEEAQRLLATAVAQAAEAIVVTDAEGKIQYVNPAFETITGYTRKEVIGQHTGLLKSGEHDQMFYRNLWETIKRGEVWTGHFINKRKDGRLYQEDSTISPVRDSNGKIVNFVAVKRDITEHLQLSAQLLQAQKMEAIGTLAGGIAHDFNNLLQVTLGYSELLLAEKRENDPEYADLQKIFSAAKSGAELVKSLLTFSRKVETKPIPLNLNRQVIQVEKLLRRTIPKMIEIELDLSDDLAEVSADPTQVEQILMNLAVNARDAMPDRGGLTIITKNATLDQEYCKVHVGAKPGEYVMLSVSDTGHGMEKAAIEHIFEPFYTTKEMGRGTGLGLAMVYGIVKQHDGHITCYSELGHGTIFNVYFPAIERQLEPDLEESSVMPAFGTETILLVNDEEFVRDLGSRILSKAGYNVLTATNGREALDIFEKERTRIALVILDLIMPEIGGKECLEELRRIDPQLKVLIASGLSDAASVRESIRIGAKGFMYKPFKSRELLRQVRKVLDEVPTV